MLTLTETAGLAVSNLVTHSPGSPTAGLRIESVAASDPASTSTEFRVSIAAEPQAGDSVVEEQGARVFLEPDAALVLDDKVLDASVDDAGGLRFSIAPQR